MNETVEQDLARGLAALNLEIPTLPLWHYLELLNKWNRAYNLTAIRDIKSMVTRHILDSLAILPWIQGGHVIDVGTGPGLPGIPLALACPDKKFVLLDSNGKKTHFLQEVKRVLKLNQIEIVHNRVESYHPSPGFDTVISRAFSHLSQMISWTDHLLMPEGIWLAMKGRVPTEELSGLPYSYRVETYSVAGLEGERCCVIIKKEHSWPK